MKTILTAKLKLTTTHEQFQALRQTQLAYRAALNFVSAYSFAHGKTSSTKKLQAATYTQVRGRFGLPAQMACSLPRQVGATSKALWTKALKAEARRLGYTKKRFKGLDQAPHYSSPTLTYDYEHDYRFKTKHHVSILTLQGQLVLPYQGYHKHMTLLEAGAEIGGAKPWCDRAKKRFYLLISLEFETPDHTPDASTCVVGVDVGQPYLATVATTNNNTQLYSGKAVRVQTDHYAKLRKRLQRQGTRAVTRRLIGAPGGERQLKLNTDHVISKRIVETHPHTFISLGDLTGIRNHTRRRKKRRKGKKLIPVSPKARMANWHAARWAFAELQGFIAYKAALAGSVCIKLDTNYTSQAYPRCGYTSKENRPNQGLPFVYQVCHYTLYADLVDARNLSLRTLLVRQDWTSMGQLSFAPDVADHETKAALLQIRGIAVESSHKLLPFSPTVGVMW